jgi:hypothetical protein
MIAHAPTYMCWLKKGTTVLLTLRTSDYNESVKLFLPRRYSIIFKDEDITKINDGTLSLIWCITAFI